MKVNGKYNLKDLIKLENIDIEKLMLDQPLLQQNIKIWKQNF